MKCKRSPSGRHWFATIRDWEPIGKHAREVTACGYCREPLSIGPSNDVGVEHEIRAAELAIGLQEGGCMVTTLEQSGFNDEPMRLRSGHAIHLDTTSQQAGRLARVICEHDKDQP